MYRSKIESEALDRLFDALSLLESREDYYRFFEDLCTVSELMSIAQRFHVARMLDEDATYTDIADVTGASTATISRVKKSLNYGADGYKLALERLHKKNHDEIE